MLDANDDFPGLIPLADMFNHLPSETLVVYFLSSFLNFYFKFNCFRQIIF